MTQIEIINDRFKTAKMQMNLLMQDIKKESYIVGLIDVYYLIDTLAHLEEDMKKQVGINKEGRSL